MKDKIIYKEKEDLYHLIHSLTNSELRQFRLFTKGPNSNKNSVYLKLFDKIRRQSVYDENVLMAKLNLNKEKLRDSKFYLLNMILESLKRAERKNPKVNFLNEMIELEILKEKGLLKKAFKKLKKLKEIVLIKHEYDLLHNIVKHTDILILFNESEGMVMETRLKRSGELDHYLDLTKNLNNYRKLSVNVLSLSYEILDRRLERKKELLNYLNHPLLAGEHMAKSDLAKYVYYEAKCLIYMGINDNENSSIYALKSWEFLNTVASPHRDDYRLLLTSLSNYLHSRLYLNDMDAYHRMMPEMETLVRENYNGLKFSMKAKTFEMRTSVLLTYLWATRNYKGFEEVYGDLYAQYIRYVDSIHPNFKAGILFHCSKLFFIGGKLEDALEWCEKLHDTQRNNPTYRTLVCGNILRIMIHYEMGNLHIIPHLVNTAEYYIKSRNRYFKIERCFIKGINRIKPFHSRTDKTELFRKLHDDLTEILKGEDERIINCMIGMEEWIKSKF